MDIVLYNVAMIGFAGLVYLPLLSYQGLRRKTMLFADPAMIKYVYDPVLTKYMYDPAFKKDVWSCIWKKSQHYRKQNLKTKEN